jgi:nitrite reductase/ring-hydroxylating ferredoxin subunit
MMAEQNHAWRHIGSVDEIPVGSRRILTVGENEIGVYNIDGNFFAVRNYCPHKGAPICMGTLSGTMLPSDHGEYVYGLEGRVLHCPWHQWAFDIETGRALFDIDRSRLICHSVERRDNDLFLDERIRKRSAAEADAPNGGRPDVADDDAVTLSSGEAATH